MPDHMEDCTRQTAAEPPTVQEIYSELGGVEEQVHNPRQPIVDKNKHDTESGKFFDYFQ